MSSFETDDFPQADRIFAVGRLVDAAYRGASGDVELEKAIGLNSEGRQGRYYRKSAVVLGLIEKHNEDYQPTQLGVQYATSSEPSFRTSILRQAVESSPVFATILEHIDLTNPSVAELRSKMFDIYPGERGTAARRWSTIYRYLIDLGLVVQLGERLVLAKRVLPGPAEPESPAGTEEPKAPADEELSNLSPRYAGFCADPVLRKAIEIQAVNQAIDHYVGLGYQVTDVGATQSYDLHVVLDKEVRHVEVKGSQGHISRIVLTKNEVVHAQTFGKTDLITVADIPWLKEGDEVKTSDGLLVAHTNWRPSEEGLEPLSYYYSLD